MLRLAEEACFMKNKGIFSLVMIIACMFFVMPAKGALATFHTTYSYGAQIADDPTLIAKYNQWVSWFVTSNGAGGYRRVQYTEGVGGQGNGTASEGIGYGMLLAVYFNDQSLFNDLWNYKVNHSPSKGLMAWLVSSSGSVVDPNSASDADFDIAMSLILASRRWGNTGTFNYNSLATIEVNKLSSSDIDGTDFHVFPGDYCSHSNPVNTYPSYFTPAWYREFGIQTGNTTFWDNVTTKCLTMLAAGCRNGSTGLATEQCSATGGAVGSTDEYNSARIPWRYSLDYIWNGTPAGNSSLPQVTLDAAFFAGKATSVGAKYNITGGAPFDTTHNGMRVGPAGTSMMITGHTADLTAFYTEASSVFNDSSHFYNATLALLALLQESGNMPRIFGAPQPTATPLAGDLFDDCEDGDNVNNFGGYWYTYDDASNAGDSLIVPWTDSRWAKVNKTPTPFYMQAPGYPSSVHGTLYAARMTGVVTTTYTYGFIGMGSGTNADSGSPKYTVTDLSMYTGLRFWVKTANATDSYSIKISCPKSVTDPAGNDYKYSFIGSTTWSLVPVPFTSLTQENWGAGTVYVSQALVLKNATDVQWQTVSQPHATVDLIVDDIEFYPAKPPTATPTYCMGENLDTLEDNNSQNDFGGYWYTYNNTTVTPPASTVWPSSAAGATFTASAPGANGSFYCARITGTVSSATVAFVGMGTNMAADGIAVRDLHAFVGLTFWIKGDGNLYSVKLKGGPTVLTGGNDYKYSFRSEVAANGWNQMTIPFSIFTQERGWGTPVASVATVLTSLQQIQWESKGISHTVDLSIDDVEFECSQGWTPTFTITVAAPSNTMTPTYTATTYYSPTFTITKSSTPTYTATSTNTLFASPTFTSTIAPPSPTSTNTLVFSPTSTFTMAPPTATYTDTMIFSPTFTNTMAPPSPTFTNTLFISPTNTNTTVADSPTSTPQPPTATSTVTNTVNTSIPIDVLIDDCDDGNNANLLGGYWYTFDDLDNSGDSNAVPWSDKHYAKLMMTPTPFYMQAPGYNATGFAARMTGTVTTTYMYGFIGLGTDLLNPQADVNVSCCSGIRFWVKGDGKQYRVKLGNVTQYPTDGSGGNMYGYVFTSTTSWQQITVPFTSMTRDGMPSPWGADKPTLADVLTGVRSIQWQTIGQPIASVDLTVDQLEFYNCVGGCIPTPVAVVPVATATSTNIPVIPTSTNTNVIPVATATNTDIIPVATQTSTNVPPTATGTDVPAGSTATFTPTVTPTNTPFASPTIMPTSNILEIIPGTVKIFPNPAINETDPIVVKFTISKAATDVRLRIFTSGMRLVREANLTLPSAGPSGSVLGASGPSSGGGDCYVGLKYEFIKQLSKGTYYIVIDVKNENDHAKPQIDKIIKLQ
jgi:endo-1,4-beta-D-glucanase Y